MTLAEYAREKAAEDPYEVAIKKAKSFNALYGAIEGGGGIESKSGKYEAADLIDVIEKVRREELEIKSVTREKKLRAKVEELLALEQGKKSK